MGTWWFIGLRAYKLEHSFPPILRNFIEVNVMLSEHESEMREKKETRNYERLRLCKICQVGYSLHLLQHKMTIKMILQTEKHLSV